MTPGSFLTMSGAAILAAYSVYELWLERVVVEVGRRRRVPDPIDLSSGSPVATRLRKFGLSLSSVAEESSEMVWQQPLDVLDDLSAYHAWLLNRTGGHMVSRVDNRPEIGGSNPAGLPPPSVARHPGGLEADQRLGDSGLS